MSLIVYYFLAFLLGSIPFAFLYGKIFHSTDIRKQGSGNSGATNSLRVFGKKAGVIVLILDMAKSLVPILLAKQYLEEPAYLYIGILAVLGHIFSPFLGFKGGKGIATGLGFAFGLNIYAGLVCALVFIAVVYFSRMVSLGSILGALAFFSYNCLNSSGNLELILISGSLFFLIMFTHRKNISLILQGKENKI
jgi:acyl phosphate:glycerol-3-phosphate acyltransferase